MNRYWSVPIQHWYLLRLPIPPRLLASQCEITIDEPDDLINDEVAVSMPVETKEKHLITWEDISKFMQYIIKKFLEICVVIEGN